MTREWADSFPGAGSRRRSIRPIRQTANSSGRVPGIVEGQDSALGEIVVRVLVSGFGILFTTTRDGGAVGVHLYQGDARASDFAASPEDLRAVIQGLHELLDAGSSKGFLAPLKGAR